MRNLSKLILNDIIIISYVQLCAAFRLYFFNYTQLQKRRKKSYKKKKNNNNKKEEKKFNQK